MAKKSKKLHFPKLMTHLSNEQNSYSTLEAGGPVENMELRGMIRNTLPNRQQIRGKRGTGNLEIINTSCIWVLTKYSDANRIINITTSILEYIQQQIIAFRSGKVI